MNYFLGTAKLAEKLSFWISRNGNLNKVETNFSPTPTIKSLVFPSQLLFDFFQVSEVLELTGNYTGGLKKWRAFITLQSKAFFFFPLVKLTMKLELCSPANIDSIQQAAYVWGLSRAETATCDVGFLTDFLRPPDFFPLLIKGRNRTQVTESERVGRF